jgi:6-phosphogluconolactonase
MTREACSTTSRSSPSRFTAWRASSRRQVAANRYESLLRNSFRLEGAESPRFDLVALGMGDDGHTASLFPHTEAIHEMGRWSSPTRSQQKDSWRISLTWPVINHASSVFFLIAGRRQSQIL